MILFGVHLEAWFQSLHPWANPCHWRLSSHVSFSLGLGVSMGQSCAFEGSGADDGGVGTSQDKALFIIQFQQCLVFSLRNFKPRIIHRAGVINLLPFSPPAEGELGQILFTDRVGEIQKRHTFHKEGHVQKQLLDVLSQNESKFNAEVWFYFFGTLVERKAKILRRIAALVEHLQVPALASCVCGPRREAVIPGRSQRPDQEGGYESLHGGNGASPAGKRKKKKASLLKRTFGGFFHSTHSGGEYTFTSHI